MALNYLNTYFLIDLIPTLPLQLLSTKNYREFYIIKTLRLTKGINFLDVSAITRYLTYYNTEIRLKDLIENDPVKANDTDDDNTHVSKLLLIGYVLKVMKLGFLIITFCYFMGMFWMIYCFEMHERTFEFNKLADPLQYNTETFVDLY